MQSRAERWIYLHGYKRKPDEKLVYNASEDPRSTKAKLSPQTTPFPLNFFAATHYCKGKWSCLTSVSLHHGAEARGTPTLFLTEWTSSYLSLYCNERVLSDCRPEKKTVKTELLRQLFPFFCALVQRNGMSRLSSCFSMFMSLEFKWNDAVWANASLLLYCTSPLKQFSL